VVIKANIFKHRDPDVCGSCIFEQLVRRDGIMKEDLFGESQFVGEFTEREAARAVTEEDECCVIDGAYRIDQELAPSILPHLALVQHNHSIVRYSE
jgi:hypothetical protein